MSIATVVTRGYGSFGSVNLLPTLGYSIGAAAVVTPIVFHVLDRGLVFTIEDRGATIQVTDRGLVWPIDEREI